MITQSTNPAKAVDPVEVLLAFIHANASEEVFEKAQALESLLRNDVDSHKGEVKEWEQKLLDLKEELTDGHKLSDYVDDLRPDALRDFVDMLLTAGEAEVEIRKQLSDELFQGGTTYLPIPETLDHMDALLAPALAERIAGLGIEEALRLLNAC